ncbi:phosphate/phosphite/phosphonate ABC transporter substrate-binding protein [Pelagibius sp.]|uniref:phosphate/phosphite/phosphonate ABC transporter substrate-binding protein n=1 Tax=Pelagibius sp. TaxID=1931238 RepID=UPI00261E4179|nr:PhnD/SsuA/transferrin family substrate-binding protein [Pelagibius sp.]
MTLIACARMYNVTETARQAWADLFAWVAETSGIALTAIDHPAPAPLETLWERADLGCAFMCGWPFSRARPQPLALAAPVPLGSRYRGQPVYFTDFIVRRDRGYRSLAETFGGRIAWTVETSHSGFNAPRHHLLAYRSAERPRLYSESLGPAVTPAQCLAWMADGRVDVAPMDSFALDLIARHEPERVAEIAVIESTAAAPIPPLVAAPDLNPERRAALRRALLASGGAPELAKVLADLGLSGFAAVAADDYGIAELWDREARAAGYPRPE